MHCNQCTHASHCMSLKLAYTFVRLNSLRPSCRRESCTKRLQLCFAPNYLRIHQRLSSRGLGSRHFQHAVPPEKKAPRPIEADQPDYLVSLTRCFNCFRRRFRNLFSSRDSSRMRLFCSCRRCDSRIINLSISSMCAFSFITISVCS